MNKKQLQKCKIEIIEDIHWTCKSIMDYEESLKSLIKELAKVNKELIRKSRKK